MGVRIDPTRFLVIGYLIAGALCLLAGAAAAETAVYQSGVTSPQTAIDPAFHDVELAPFQPGNPDIALSVNLPAFRLSLWQQGREVARYPIGIAQAKFPIPAGQWKAWAVMWNPPWIPPDSDWVLKKRKDVEPGEVIYAGDKRNPLGKIKIPLGKAYLIHQAQGPGDLGNMVSHGCIRVMLPDLEDLAHKIIAARAPQTPQDKIAEAEQTKKYFQVALTPPLLVDVLYDTIVVEGGALHIYPDVYKRGQNTVDNLRAELAVAGVNSSGLGDGELRRILSGAKKKQPVVIALQDFPRQDPVQALPVDAAEVDTFSQASPLYYERE
jgi:hypothetical protein